MVINVIDLNACDLMLNICRRWLYPEDVFFVPFHNLHDSFEPKGGWGATGHSCFDNFELGDVYDFHCCVGTLTLCFQGNYFVKKWNKIK